MASNDLGPVIGQGTSGLGEGFHIPTKIIEGGLLSETTEAHECFVNQQFSASLQAYLLDYVISVLGDRAVYA